MTLKPKELSDQVLLALSLHALESQHQAIDLLLALVMQADKNFRPTQSGQIWEAVTGGHMVLERLRERLPKIAKGGDLTAKTLKGALPS